MKKVISICLLASSLVILLTHAIADTASTHCASCMTGLKDTANAAAAHLETAQQVLDADIWCKPSDEKVTPAQMNAIRPMLADRAHRVTHSLWHTARSDLSQPEIETIRTHFSAQWISPNKTCPLPGDDASSSNYNPVGEDFLFKHHKMLQDVQRKLQAAGKACIGGWTEIPAASDLRWPITGKKVGPKSEEALAHFKNWEKTFNDESSGGWLSKHSLSAVGQMLEVTIHNNMHMRWATDAPPKGFGKEGATLPMNGVFPETWPFDKPGYDWLADPYGAHVNPTFWKLHGLIDNLIPKWLKAHKLSRISEHCGNDKTCYTWKGTWTGGPVPEAKAKVLTRGEPDKPTQPLPKNSFQRGLLTPTRLKEMSSKRGSDRGLPKGLGEDPENFVKEQLCK